MKTMLALALSLTLCGFSACSSFPTQHQKIAAACASAATAADAVSAGAEAGRVTVAQAQQAVKVYRTTVPYCEPVPVSSLDSDDYAALLSAAAQLATISEKAK